MFYRTYYDSPIGILTLYSDGENLIEVRFPKDRHEAIKSNEETIIKDDLLIFDKTRNWLKRYFSHEKTEISELSFNFIGSEFRKKVWKCLCEIPYGEVVTYKDIARKISPTMSAQAVGSAVGYNPICIIVPCHRVIGANNNLVGFGRRLGYKKVVIKT